MDETTKHGLPKPTQHESGATFATTFATKMDAADTSINDAIVALTALGTIADHDAIGQTFTGTAGENVALGDVCYLKSDGKFWKADASAASTMPGVVMATATILADATGVFLLRGIVRDDSGWGGALTVGGLLYVSGTAGPPTQTPPAVSGDQVQVVGYAGAARIVFFDPCLILVEVP